MLTFLSYLVVFWQGIGFGFFFRRLAAMAACIAFCVLAFAPTSAGAMTKQECVQAGYGCRYSHATGGRAHGWYFAKAKEARHAGNADGTRMAVQHPQAIAVRVALAGAARSVVASERHPSGAVEQKAEAQGQANPIPAEAVPPRLTPGQEREEAMRRLARCPAVGLDAVEHEEGKRLLAAMLAQRKAQLTEAGR
jgi:hypothetical protein